MSGRHMMALRKEAGTATESVCRSKTTVKQSIIHAVTKTKGQPSQIRKAVGQLDCSMYGCREAGAEARVDPLAISTSTQRLQFLLESATLTLLRNEY